MHLKKKRKLFVLYSIPIINNLCKRCKEKLYLVSSSIPLVCAGVLLLGLFMMVNLDSPAKTNAVEIGEVSEIEANKAENDKVAQESNDGISLASDATNPDSGIMTLANVNPSLSLSVSNSNKEINTVQGGNTAYSDHVVTITGEEVTNYTLSMSSTSSNLTKPSGTSGKDITGAGGVSGNSMEANKWGYTVTEESTSNSNYGGLTYSTVPTSNTTIATGNATSTNTLNVKKKIIFAAKFGEDAAPGNYKHSINLSAVANATTVTFKITYDSNGGGTAPAADSKSSMENSVNFTLAGQGSMSKAGYKFVGWSTNQSATTGSAAGGSYTVTRTQPQVTLYAVWKLTLGEWSNGVNSGVTNMQDITSSFCSTSIPAGSTITLKDNRGSNPISYKIIKMGDGTCWMAENLRLMNTTINSTNSDMTSGSFTIPASNKSGFTSSDQYERKAYYENDITYGAYYNWYTATAGTGNSSIDGTTGKDIADSSMCPKGWKLPAYEGVGSFQNIVYSSTGGYQDKKGSWTILNGKNGRIFGFNSDDAFWPAPGRVNNGSLEYADSEGDYWSRRAHNSSQAYILSFYGSEAYPQRTHFRCYGFPVRCVANY